MHIMRAKRLSRLDTAIDSATRLEYAVEQTMLAVGERAMRGFSQVIVGPSKTADVELRIGVRTGPANSAHRIFRDDYIKHIRALGYECSNTTMQAGDENLTVSW